MPKFNCSLCSSPVDGRKLISPQKMENLILDIIKKDRPEWDAKRGICPNCHEQFRAKKFLGYLEKEYAKISEMEQAVVTQIARRGRVSKLVQQEYEAAMTFGERIADRVAKFGGMEALDAPYTEIRLGTMIKKRAGWLCALFISEMFTASAMSHFEHEIAQAVVLALFIPLIISSGGNSGSQATSLIIRAMALREVTLRDWWRVAMRELPSGIALGIILGAIGVTRILSWQALGWYDYGIHHVLIAATVGTALVGVVTFGSLTGSMLPFLLRRLGFDPASASAPFVATLVDVTGIVIYFTIAALMLRGTLL